MSALGILWFILVVVLIIGYFALDGFDLGAGVLYPFIAKNDTDKKRVIKAIGPVWDGNEVWLLTAGGALFAAFPAAYASSFSGFYLAIMLVLFGLILRAVSIEFRMHEEKLTGLWDGCFFIGSLLPALLLGVACGNILGGVPLDAGGDYTGTFLALLNPFALLCGLLGLTHMLTQGSAWLSLKTALDGDLRARAVKLRRSCAIVSIVLFILCTLLFFCVVKPSLAYEPFSIMLAGLCAVLYVVLMAGLGFSGGVNASGSDVLAPILAGIGCACLVLVFALTLFPNLIPATELANSITIATAASGDSTLGAMTIIAGIGVPLVLIYHVVVYWIFRGRIE